MGLAEKGDAPVFDGFYASASWFLTGESRSYDAAEGMFGRVIPNHPFDWGRGGWGAWEVAARYSQVDLDDAGVHGGRLGMWMLGANWYPHSHVKWRFDYGIGQVEGPSNDGRLQVFATRFEMDF